MSVDVEKMKRLLVLHANLRSAAGYLDVPIPAHIPEHVTLAKVLEQLTEPALIAWMTELAETGAAGRPKAAFWRILEQAAELVGMQERLVEFRARFFAVVASKDDGRGAGAQCVGEDVP